MVTKVKGGKKVRTQAGMSLIEILVVLAIIGGVMALIAPNIFRNKQKANMKTAKIMITKIENAINEFYSDCDQLPQSLDNLITAPGDEICESWGPGAYIKESELRDPWKNDFVFEVTSEGFEVKSLGQDGAPGGEGIDEDITNK